jgi:hypothetical protein
VIAAKDCRTLLTDSAAGLVPSSEDNVDIDVRVKKNLLIHRTAGFAVAAHVLPRIGVFSEIYQLRT